MKIGWLLKESTDKTNIQNKLSVLTAIIEQNLEYILNLVSTLEDPTVKYKNEDSSNKLAKLKADIKFDITNYSPEEIVKIITFTTLMESVYNSTNEIKDFIKEAVKYPPIGFDLSEIAIKISGIAKKQIDGFFAGNTTLCPQEEIIATERLINATLRRLNKLNGKENREKGRIVYYSCIITVLKEILEKTSSLQFVRVPTPA